MRRLAIITARGGSKRIPRKNIKEFCGKPIIAYSIEAALESGAFDEVMVSTDDKEIAEVALAYGAKVPFYRSEATSNDYATTNDVLAEVLGEYEKRGENVWVAKNAKVSPSYLTALFQKHLQISPGEYIRRIKLQESKQMIREGSMNFTEISEALQYSTVHHFSRQFKEKFGITPTEYAKSVR